MVTRLARTKPERKNVKRTRKNVRRTRRCKRIVLRRARSARNKRQYSYEARSCRCPNYDIIGDDKFSDQSYLPINLFMFT